MRVLITGKNGQMAQALCHGHDPSRHDFIFIGRPAHDLAQPLDFERLLDTYAPDIVLSIAAHTQVDLCESEPDLAFRLNAEAPRLLARAAHNIQIPILHLSTDYVFDGLGARPYVESDPPRPLNTYGQSKWAGEVAIAEETERHAIVRVTWIYSQFGSNFVKSMLEKAATHSELRVIDDQVACPTEASDLAHVLMTMADLLIHEPKPERYGIFHGAWASAIDRFSLIEATLDIAAHSGHPRPRLERAKSEDFASAATRPPYSALDNAKLMAAYGVAPKPWQIALGPVVEQIVRGRS